MTDRKNTGPSLSNNPDSSDKGSGFRHEKHAYVGEPLSNVQQIPLPTQVNVPVSTDRSSSHKQ
jgi:hypothetical protein